MAIDSILDDYMEIEEIFAPSPPRSFKLAPDYVAKRPNPAHPRETGPRTSMSLQSYLTERFADQSIKGEQYRALQRENQRKHDRAAKNWPSQYT
jgi:hypothetical protein